MDDLFLQEMASRRQRMLADVLRKQALQEQYIGAPGQMISGRYVAPSWAQSLNQGLKPAAADRQATRQEALASAGEAQFQTGLNQARGQWQSALPQAIKGIPERQGPMDPNNPAELSAIPDQPITTGQILRHTLAGLNIPGNEKAAALYNQSALGDLAREDQQLFRSEEAAASRSAALQRDLEARAARLEELRIRLEDRVLDRASREAMAREQRALTQQIANGNLELRRMAIEAKAQADANRREEKQTVVAEKAKITTEGEKSSAGYLNRMREAEKKLSSIGAEGDMELIDKAIGGLPMAGKTLQPYVLNVDQQKLYQAQRDWVRAKLRKESGAVIGDEEMAEEIRTYFPQPGESADLRKQKAKVRKEAERQMEIGSGRELPNAVPFAPGAAQNSGALSAAEQAELMHLKRRLGK